MPLTLLHLLLKHLEGSGSHAQIDFSSAFNTIQPYILANHLIEQFDFGSSLVGWILDFLTNRTQRVKVNGALSGQLCSSTGLPQGCVLSPLLFILYTNACQTKYVNRTIIKYADDSVIVSLLHENDRGHGPKIEDFVQWCKESHHQLNVSKTKDMYIHFGKTQGYEATTINGQLVDQVQSYRYLGTIIDSKLNFQENCEVFCKKGQQRLYF